MIPMPMKNVIVEVKCPQCGRTRNTKTLKQVKCFHCEKSFRVILKSKNTSRITKIVKGTQEELQKEFYKQGVYKKRN